MDFRTISGAVRETELGHWVERGEGVAKVIVGWRAIFEGAQPAQKLNFFLAKSAMFVNVSVPARNAS